MERTPTETLKIINDLKNDHEALKNEAILICDKIKSLEEEINLYQDKANSIFKDIETVEKLYVALMNELNQNS